MVDGLLTADCAHFRAIRPVEQAYQDAETVRLALLFGRVQAPAELLSKWI